MDRDTHRDQENPTDRDPFNLPESDWAAGEAVTRDQDGTDTDDNAADFTCQPRAPGQ